jgi:hypothetical protein
MVSNKQDSQAPTDDAVIGQAFLVSLGVIALLAVVGATAWFFFGSSTELIEVIEGDFELPEIRQTEQIDFPAVSFTDVTKLWGIDFQHTNGATGDKFLPETMGSGCAAFDYDSDGDIDLLFINSQAWSPGKEPPATMKLYRNDGGAFVDVTVDVGLDVSMYGMGVAVGDIDNDHDPDLFVTAVGKNRLFVQDEGRFVETEAGVSGGADWSTSCGFFDYDRDGLLDLFVCNYLQWSAEYDASQEFRLSGVGRAYGPPGSFEGTFPFLYHNEGGGKFRDVSAESGVQVKNRLRAVPAAKSLGMATVDIDQDGWVDVFVANDTVRNYLLRNKGDGTFEEVGGSAGIAFDSAGKARGAMGTDVDFLRENGQLAIGIGNFSNEASALYMKQSTQMLFLDEATSTGFGPPTRTELTFGLFFFDFDLDGLLDVFGANGHLESDIEKVQEQTYEQVPHLFWNRGAGMKSNEFAQVPAKVVGADFAAPIVGRAAVSADFDGDGDLDLVITQSGRAAKILRNDQTLGHHSLKVLPRGNGRTVSRDAVGAVVEAQVGDRTIRRQVTRTRSYLSQSPLTVVLGIGKAEAIDKLLVRWPDGTQKIVVGPFQHGQSLEIKQDE